LPVMRLRLLPAVELVTGISAGCPGLQAGEGTGVPRNGAEVCT
jgi:hypothetical protein